MSNNILPCEGWKNANGTSDRICRCGSWKNHWLRYSDVALWPKTCSVEGCCNPATLGAHIYNPSISNKIYIVPMCDSCNQKRYTFILKNGINLASSNKQETCNK